MNWGYKITVAYIAFITFIMYMVVQAFGQDIDLVTKDYYAQEIAYETKMVRKANALHAEEQVEVKQTLQEIIIKIPGGAGTSGEIHFYHPSQQIFDRRFEIDLDSKSEQQISKEEIVSGHYRINVSWEQDGKEYFKQEKIYIP